MQFIYDNWSSSKYLNRISVTNVLVQISNLNRMSNITRILFHILSSPLCKNKDILVLFCFVALLLLLCQNAPCLLPCLHTSIFGKDQNVTKVFQAPKIKSRSVASASKLLYIRTCARFLLTAFETCVKRYTDREAGSSNRTAEQNKTEYLF